MVATQTLPQYSRHCNFGTITPRQGVVTLSGYGINVHVDRGHLTIEDGVGAVRRRARFPRVGRGLKRLVVIGSDGMVSLAALRWLADQNATFAMLDRDGKVLATTGPVSPSDVRLRRAQALAHQSDLALRIARELIDQKLRNQEVVIKKYFPDSLAVEAIAKARGMLLTAESSDEIRLFESQGALAYWSAWHDLSIQFPRIDLPRVPDHWRRFGSRISPLTRSPRLAVNPPNAMLNYLYAILESEARLALATLGLDPGIGVLHNDLRSRDSLACDLMEPIRPQVDAFLLDWLTRGQVKRDWFFEQRDGNCRLMASIAAQLSETAKVWRTALAPFAEGIARSFWLANPLKSVRSDGLPTRLTQARKRKTRDLSPELPATRIPKPLTWCRLCGCTIQSGFKYCRSCVPAISRENVVKAAKLGRLATHSPEAQARRSETQRRQNAARNSWNPASNPAWLSEQFYKDHIQGALRRIQVPVIQRDLSISEPYALRIRSGRCIPHPRHWQILAKLVGSL
jgi:CRISPR-associated endonuclease Cas1